MGELKGRKTTSYYLILKLRRLPTETRKWKEQEKKIIEKNEVAIAQENQLKMKDYVISSYDDYPPPTMRPTIAANNFELKPSLI